MAFIITRNQRKREKIKRYIAFFLALNILAEVVSPTAAFALTGGTYQPEFTSFEPAGSSEMVDLFTGDFKYNIPLLDVEGYPVNLAYHAGVGMEQEAGWVGLGWSVNTGAINRMMKGLPDDFNGDVVKSETYIRPRYTVGVGAEHVRSNNSSISYESMTIGTSTGLSAGVMLLYNNYKGFGIEPHLDASLAVNTGFGGCGSTIGGGIGMNVSSLDGATISEHYSASQSVGYGGYGASLNVGVGSSINTRTGDETKSYFASVGFSTPMVAASVGSSHTVPVGSYAQTPRFYNDHIGLGASLTAKLGFYQCLKVTIYGITFGIDQGQYFGFNAMLNYSQIRNPVNNLGSFGYMYLQNSNNNCLLDFNRDKDGPFFRETPHAPMSMYTYDVFSATAQGLYTNFRTHRSEIGTVYDSKGSLLSGSKHVGLEGGVGIFLHTLVDKQTSVNIGSSGKWNTQLPKTQNYYQPNLLSSGDRYYESAYLKSMGEMTPHDPLYSGKINGESYVQPQLFASSATTPGALNTFAGSGSAGIGGSIKRNNKRDVRKNNIVYLSAAEASNYGLETQINNFPLNTSSNININASTRDVDGATTIGRTSLAGSATIDHHISEISITNDKGQRYFYGIPVYNTLKKKVSFNASDMKSLASAAIPLLSTTIDLGPPTSSPLSKNATYEMTSYSPSLDASMFNKRGLDHLYHKEEIPPYAQSYLLTCIVSPDYVDLTGNGPSYDDLGEYTKFNYSKKSSEYKWRMPACPSSNMAALDRGLIADQMDDKAFYEYGTRQVWYLHSIETKNYVAEFVLDGNDRSDMQSVKEDGSIDATFNRNLTEINLYTKSELLRHQTDVLVHPADKPVPIKSVHFEYDNSLCNGVFNGVSGKLTLKKVYFTYGTSKKSRLSPYIFAYGDPDHDGDTDPSYNPDYDPKGVDRWGMCLKRSSANQNATGTSGFLNLDEFPYADQRKDSADVAAAAWNLSTIYTPTGSKINVDYESDDYGYVQNKPAGQMLMLADVTNSGSSWTPSTPNNDITTSRYLILDLERLQANGIKTTVSGSAASALVRNSLLRNINEIYFKCFTNLNSQNIMVGNNTTYKEFVSGYAEVDYTGVGIIPSSAGMYSVGSTNYYKYAYVAVKMDGHKDDGSGTLINPITKAGWQMMRLYLPKIAYPGSETNNLGTNTSNPINILVSLLTGLSTALFDLAAGHSDDPNFRFFMKKYCKEIDYKKSWVRAFSPYKKKLGGGHRVKQITMNDNWNTMTGENESVYGQTYEYTVKEGTNTISSGVASYEPLIGGDEISLRKPTNFSVPHRIAPNDQYFMEEPLGEIFYPNALVGYSKVTIKNIDHVYEGNEVCPIGQTTYEFYTAKDFPVQSSNSGISRLEMESSGIDKFTIFAPYFKSLSVSEGHVLKFNDMHGKLKGIYTFAPGNLNAPISGTTYYYKRAGNRVVQNVSTIDENKSISSTYLGRDIDAVTDLRHSGNFHIGINNQTWFNIAACDNPMFGGALSFGMEKFEFNQAVSSKIVQQYGILEKVEAFDNKSKVTTENILWDKNTGDVVLTKTVNNYDDPVYTFNYPAYWMYPDMGASYQRQNITVTATGSGIWDDGTGKLDASMIGPLKEGDEVSVTSLTGSTARAWIVKNNAGDHYLLDVDGDAIKNTTVPGGYPYFIKVLRPVERNQFNYSAGSVTTLHNPLVSTGGSGTPDLDDQVVSASAIEYCSRWNMYCTDGANPQDCYAGSGGFNYFTCGLQGNWRPWRTFSFNTTRNYSSSQPNTKADGTFSGFSTFWKRDGSPSKWRPIYDTIGGSYNRWVLNSENMAFTPHGNLIETKDALGLYHSQLYGFNHTLVSAKANNAKASQIGYDGFEDYTNIYNFLGTTCSQSSQNNFNIFGLINSSGTPVIDTNEAHTGRNSLYIGSGQSLSVTYETYPPPVSPTYYDAPRNCTNRYGCANKLILEPGKYVSSFWLKSSNTDDNTVLPGLVSAPTPMFGSTSGGYATNTITYTKKINGWQKFDVYFTITGTSPVTLTFRGLSAGVYLDDWRIHPLNASMVTYAYDPIHLRPWAELDNNNFATIMEYDNEGTLVRTKKETERGLYTLTENRKSLLK